MTKGSLLAAPRGTVAGAGRRVAAAPEEGAPERTPAGGSLPGPETTEGNCPMTTNDPHPAGVGDDRSRSGPPQRAASASRPGLLGAAAGGALTLLAFFAMPLISVGPFSATSANAAGASGSLGSELGGLALLWLIPIAAVAVLAVAASELFTGSTTGSGRGTAAAVLGGVAVLVYVVALLWALGQAGRIGASSQVFSVLGAGFWLGLIGSVVAVIGGIVAARAASGSR